jgi:hypothetical protein
MADELDLEELFIEYLEHAYPGSERGSLISAQQLKEVKPAYYAGLATASALAGKNGLSELRKGVKLYLDSVESRLLNKKKH